MQIMARSEAKRILRVLRLGSASVDMAARKFSHIQYVNERRGTVRKLHSSARSHKPGFVSTAARILMASPSPTVILTEAKDLIRSLSYLKQWAAILQDERERTVS